MTTKGLKITHIDYLIVSSGEEAQHILTGLPARLHSRCWPEVASPPQAGLGKGQLPSSVRMLAELISLGLQDSRWLIFSNSVRRARL